MRRPAPAGGTGWSLTCRPIPASCRKAGSGQAELPEEAVQTRTDFVGRLRRRGAAEGRNPPLYLHRPRPDVEKIEVDAEASGAMVGFNVHFHSLASASITALFS